MNVVRKIARNNSFLFLAEFITSLSSLIVLIGVGRILGDVSLGRFSFACAFPQMLTVFIDLGYGTFLIKEVARNKSLAGYYLGNIVGIRLIFLIINVVFLVLIVNILGYPQEMIIIVYLFGFFEFLRTFSNIFRLVFRAFERMQYEAAVVFIGTLIRTIFSIFLLLNGYTLIDIGYVFVITGLIEAVVSVLICDLKFVRPSIKLDFSFFLKTIKVAFPLGLLTILGIIYIRIDTVFLSILKGDAVVGWYNASYNLVLGFHPIPHLFMHSLLPMMSYLHLTSKMKLQKGYEKSFKYLLFLGLPISTGAFILAPDFILLFYGSGFDNSITALQILSWDIIIKFLYICSSFVLISSDRQNRMVIITAVSALINIVLNAILIPGYSYVGAGIATLITECFILFSYMYLNKKIGMNLHLVRFMFQPIIACIIMGFVLWQLNFLDLSIKVILGVAIYFSIIILTKGFDKEDYLMFKNLLKK